MEPHKFSRVRKTPSISRHTVFEGLQSDRKKRPPVVEYCNLFWNSNMFAFILIFFSLAYCLDFNETFLLQSIIATVETKLLVEHNKCCCRFAYMKFSLSWVLFTTFKHKRFNHCNKWIMNCSVCSNIWIAAQFSWNHMAVQWYSSEILFLFLIEQVFAIWRSSKRPKTICTGNPILTLCPLFTVWYL